MLAQDRSKTKKRVAFSRFSELFLYEQDRKALLNMAYTAADLQNACVEASLETRRITDLIHSAHPDESPADSLRLLIKDKTVLIEELIGIETYIFGQALTVHRIRRMHERIVLQEQRQQQMRNLEDPARLGLLSENLSRVSVQSARARAAMARMK